MSRSSAIELLFVCTGNRHRSPMAQAIMSTLVASRGIDAHISSAGLLPGHEPLPTETQEALRCLGFRTATPPLFSSTQVSLPAIEAADLIVGMAREHVREVAVAVPQAWDRTYTLKELVRRGNALGPRGQGQALSAWLANLGDGRARSDLLGASPDDDVADPIGGPPGAFERSAQEIAELCISLVSLLWPS